MVMDAPAAAQPRPASSRPATIPPDAPTRPSTQSAPKRRKLTTAREEVSAHYAISPTEDDAVIRQRLLTRTTTTRGEPPLKKLLKKFVAFASEVEKDADNFADCEKLYRSFLQELSTFELPLLKTKVVIDANRREQECFKELQAELSQQIVQAQADIEDLKVQLEESKVERQHKEECEAIRRLIGAQPPRSETQRGLDELARELSALESENMAASKTLELRKKQFALLLHVVDDLQSTIEDELKAPSEDYKLIAEDQRNFNGEKVTTEQELGATKPVIDNNGSTEPMQIEQSCLSCVVSLSFLFELRRMQHVFLHVLFSSFAKEKKEAMPQSCVGLFTGNFKNVRRSLVKVYLLKGGPCPSSSMALGLP